MICVGDLVLPMEANEFLFSSPEAAVEETDPIDVVWEVDSPGVVLRVLSFSPPREYCHVRVLVGDVVGWTFSDYVSVISQGP
jgi:hypothetical protein